MFFKILKIVSEYINLFYLFSRNRKFSSCWLSKFYVHIFFISSHFLLPIVGSSPNGCTIYGHVLLFKLTGNHADLKTGDASNLLIIWPIEMLRCKKFLLKGSAYWCSRGSLWDFWYFAINQYLHKLASFVCF